MARLTLNGTEIPFTPGATVLEVARAGGVEIPTLCWYPQLSRPASCRLCLVSAGDAGRLVPACAAPAEDGQVVETESAAAVANRRAVLAMLLDRYPGAHLANGGRASPRNEFERWVVHYGLTPGAEAVLPLRAGDPRPGDVMIGHDMTRCVLCTRCVRACDEIQQVGVLDVGRRGVEARIVVGADGDADRAGCTWCGECVRVCPTEAIYEVLPRTQFSPEAIRQPERIVRTVCPYCAVGCQLDVHVTDGQLVRVTSPWIEEDTPNQGSTCVKGRFGYDFPQHRDRLTVPLIRRGWERDPSGRWRWTGASSRHREGPWPTIAELGGTRKSRPPFRQTGKARWTGPAVPAADDVRDRVATPADWYTPFREATWEEALSLTSQELGRIRAEQGPRALATFASAKCTNEENYLLMRLFRGALGTNNVDHCTRLCHSTSVAAMNRAMSTAAASGSMREIEAACDVIFIAGANTTESHPVFGALIKRAVARGATLIVADVRRTELAGLADIHLQMLPGTDVALYNTMLRHILDQGLANEAFIASRTRGIEALRAALEPYTLALGEQLTGIPAGTIRRAAEAYARGPNTSTLWAMGLTQHATGTDIVASLLNLLLCCGMIGRWGAAMLPIRGQNNVQGASDVGAIPFVYTDYRPVTDPAVRAEYAAEWGVDPEALSLEPGMMVTEMAHEGSPVRGLYIMGENPVISDPDVARAEAWFRNLEFLAVQDLFLTETARWADVVLPGASFAEKTGTVVNTERRIQLMELALEPPGQARGDLDILLDLSERLGLPIRARNAAEVMEEIARVTPSWRGVRHDALRKGGLQYPVPEMGHPGTAFLFEERFPTADGRAGLEPVSFLPPSELPDAEYPFVMNTGRQMYHWHTGTMTRRATGLDSREPVPIVEIHADDAAALGLADGDPVRLTSRRGSIELGARISDRQARGQVFVPFHFREAAANLLTNPALDPYAKIASFKVSAVRVEAAGPRAG